MPDPEDDPLLGEGFTPHDEAGVTLADLRAKGFFDDVTDEHRRKAKAYFAKHWRRIRRKGAR